MTAVTPFDFAGQQVRVIEIDGEPWFVGTDVAIALGYSNPSDAARRVDADDQQTATLALSEGSREVTRERTLINESGVYELVFSSSLAAARDFKRWVTRDVLPAIRKTGTYSTTPALPQTYAEALRELASTVEAKELAEQRAAELEPPARAWEHLASSSGDYSVAEAAKVLSRDHSVLIGQRRLFDRLGEWKWLYRSAGDWHPYQAQVDNGRLATRARSHHHPRTGELIADAPQIRVTTKGLGEILRRLTEAVAS